METEAAPMETSTDNSTSVDPLDINKHPKLIREAQQEIGKLDILVCGLCHGVYHFVEQFQAHRLVGSCTGTSTIRENNVNESKGQVWAFLLWKGAQTLEDHENSWVVYQRWCKLDSDVKEAWVAAGARVQAFTKLSAARMQEVRSKALVKPKQQIEDELSMMEEGEIKDPLADTDPSDMDSELDTEEEAEKEEMKRNNGTNEAAADKENGIKKPPPIVKPVAIEVKLSRIGKRTDKITCTVKEGVVERILAKRFNPRKKTYEYLIKWEGFTHDQNTWEPPIHLNTCQHLVDAFERNLARQKEAKAAAQAALLKKQQQIKQQAGPSGVTASGRPQRTSKQKALDQVKQWCGNISDRDDELGLKRRGDSDSDDPDEKKIKLEYDSGSEDEWQADESEIERHTTVSRPKILQKTTNVINGIAKKQMTAAEVARSIGLASPDRPNSPPVLLTNTKGVVKVFKNQMPNLSSGVYIMSKKDGIVKLESSPNVITTSSANIVRVQKTAGGQQTTSIIRMAPKPTATTQMRMVPKAVVSAINSATDGVRLSPGMSRSALTSKIKTPIKPAVRVNSTGQKDRLQSQRMLVGTPKLSIVHRGGVVRPVGQRMPPLMTFMDVPETEVKSESSEDDFDPFPKDLPPPEPDSPPREFTLDPITGLVLGQAEGEPEPQPQEAQEPQEEPEVHKPIIIKHEQIDEATGQDMPSLIIPDSSGETTTITLPDNGEPLMITGEDGVVYQVAGQNEEGQTLLVAQGADGQMYVTAATTSEDAQNNVLTLDSAVAEAMGDTENAAVAEMEPLTVNTATMEDQGDEDGSSQVVAQLVKAELPSPGGTRKVVLLLPDGNLLMTEVDAEQYAALELDK